MRIWNGLSINDKVKYFDNEYIIMKLYEKSGKKVADLKDFVNNKTIEKADIYLCEKLKN